ncbi:MAG: helix-turn-helix domain-containing protein [Candidatus Kapaibacterium sp.]
MEIDDLINKIQPIGITRREAEVYIALLKNSALTAGEIAKITSVSLNKIYEVLQSLVKKKMCTENFLNGSKLFSCIEPHIAFKNVILKYQEEIDRKKEMYLDVEESLMEIYKDRTLKTPLDYIEVLSDRGQATDRFLSIEANADKEILFFSKGPYVVELGENVSKVENACNSQVKVKSIYESMDAKTREEKNNLIRLIRRYESVGEEARIINELPIKLVIVDESISIVSLLDNVSINPSLTTMIVHHNIFAKSQKTLFELYWDKAITVDEYIATQMEKSKEKIIV